MARLVEVGRRLPNGNHYGSELGRGPARSVSLRLPGVPGELPCQLRSDARRETGRIQFDAARLAGAAGLTAGQAGSALNDIIRLVRSQAGERLQRSSGALHPPHNEMLALLSALIAFRFRLSVAICPLQPELMPCTFRFAPDMFFPWLHTFADPCRTS